MSRRSASLKRNFFYRNGLRRSRAAERPCSPFPRRAWERGCCCGFGECLYGIFSDGFLVGNPLWRLNFGGFWVDVELRGVVRAASELERSRARTMSLFGKNSGHTVQPANRARPGTRVLVLLCAITFAVVYWSGLWAKRSDSAKGPFSATATIVRLLHGGEDLQPPSPEAVRRQITSPESLQRVLPEDDAAERVRVAVDRSSTDDVVKIGVTVVDPDGENAARLADGLAENYVEDCRGRWKAQSQPALPKARQRRQQAQQNWAAAKARFEAFADSHLAQPKRAKEPTVVERPLVAESISLPPPVDNPRRVEVSEQLAQLRRRREELLVDRTPVHPLVESIQQRIAETEQLLHSIAQTVPSEQPQMTIAPERPMVVEPAPEEEVATAREFQKLKRAVAETSHALEVAARAERELLARPRQMPAIWVEPARVTKLSQKPSPRRGLALLALAAGLAMASGVGMISTAAGMSCPLSSVAEVRDALPVPVVGSIQPVDSQQSGPPAKSHRPLVRVTAIVAGLVLVVGCIVVVLGALGR